LSGFEHHRALTLGDLLQQIDADEVLGTHNLHHIRHFPKFVRDASLPVTVDTSAAIIGFQLNFNTLAKAAIMGLYKR
jgi:hypothetical protein